MESDQKTSDELLLANVTTTTTTTTSQSISILRSIENNEDVYVDDNDDEDNGDSESNESETSLSYENYSDANIDDTKSNKSVDELACFSPPKNHRALKSIKKRNKTNRKSKDSNRKLNNQKLINSAQYIDKLSTEELAKLTDSLNNMQEEHINSTNSNNNSNNSLSAPATSAIQSSQIQSFNTTYNYWEQSAHSRSNNNLCENRVTYSEKSRSGSIQLNLANKKEAHAKIHRLLKLALSCNTQNKQSYETNIAPPPTPASSNIYQDRRFEPLSPFNNSSKQSLVISGSNLSPLHSQHRNQIDEANRIAKAESIWKHMYDFFVHYNDRALQNEDLIQKRLTEARSIIPIRVEDTLNTNFSSITSHMNQEISKFMKKPSDYSYLYERKTYIDQMCYLLWFVEDVCNQVSYIETLYPSTRILREKHPCYANPKFESINKTLLLWYKIVFDLMHTCDLVGKYLGFEKKPENKQYWTWFDERLKFSKIEFSNVQTWLDKGSPNSLNKVHDSPVICVTRPTFEDFETLIQRENANHSHLKTSFDYLNPTKHRRQISFELKSKKASNFYVSPSISNSSQKFEFESPIPSNTSKNEKAVINNYSELIEASSTSENKHLKHVKLHHLYSYFSRSSSYKSNDTPSSGLSSSFNLSLNDVQTPKNQNTSNGPVGFYLNDTNVDPDVYESLSNINTLSNNPNLAFNNDEEKLLPSKMPAEVNRNDGESSTRPSYINSDLDTNRQKIFSDFLHKRMRKQGLTKMCEEMRKVILDPLSNALHALQMDRCERKTYSCENQCYYHLMPLHHQCVDYINRRPVDDETIQFGIRSESFKCLDLPTFRPLYMYLINVIIDMMHMSIKKQIENKGDMKMQIENKLDFNVETNFKFSLFSIEALTNECKECIEQAILTRQFYYHMVFSVFELSEMDVQTALENDLVPYDNDLKKLIDIYLRFITDWIHDLVATQDLSKALHVLQEEWKFCKNNLYFVTSSEDMYAKRFCTMCTSLFHGSLTDSLSYIDNQYRQTLVEYITNVEMNQDSLTDNFNFSSLPSETHETNNNINVNSEEAAEAKANVELNENYDNDNEDEDENEDDNNNYLENSYSEFDVNLKCNEFKEELNDLRKQTLEALEFCDHLLGDLELAAKYTVKSSIQTLLTKLKATNYVLVSFTNPELKSYIQKSSNSSETCFEPKITNSSFSSNDNLEQSMEEKNQLSSYMIFVPQEFSGDKTQIVRLLFIISEKNDYESSSNHNNNNSEINKNVNLQDNNNKKSNPVRRLSSSNSFFDSHTDNQCHSYLNKLSKIANLNNLKENPDAENVTKSPFTISPVTKLNGYLLYLQLPWGLQENLQWEGSTINLYASMPVKTSLYQHKNNSKEMVKLILVTPKQAILKEKRIEIEKNLEDTIELIREKTSFHPNIEQAIDELKDSILSFRKSTVECIKSIEKDLKNSVHYENDVTCHIHNIIDQRYLSEIWRVSYNLGIDLLNECIKFMTKDRAKEFSICLAEFSIMWCNYILDKTERGKGRTVHPWAAKKGIQLILEAWEQSINLDDEDFYLLQASVEKCMGHVIGARPSSSTQSIKSSHSMIINDPKITTFTDHHPRSTPQLSQEDKGSQKSLFKKINQNVPPSQRFEKSCASIESYREESLLYKRNIGKIMDPRGKGREQPVITATEVSFRWQLGLLIGEGQFGKVYSCVNLENGEPMAMKEIPFKSNQITTIKEIANEINNLQGINHENLVKFYGAELSRKEILIFMEFCGNQCALDRLSREASGLPEKIVRNYTKSLLKAVECLHENKIMHRDIKGANIFLKAIDPKQPDKIVLKLGDFGCSIKFRDPIDPINNRTAQATGFMGTVAFMAPEVSKCSGSMDAGYTYVADIWSVGCVVIEMFSGKRPWHPLSDENIMVKVHIEQKQQKPSYPPNLQDEAIDFLNKCLEFFPEKRWTADQLLDHPFVQIPLVD